MIVYDLSDAIITQKDCNGNCAIGETLLIPATTLVNRVSVVLVGINNLDAAYGANPSVALLNQKEQAISV